MCSLICFIIYEFSVTTVRLIYENNLKINTISISTITSITVAVLVLLASNNQAALSLEDTLHNLECDKHTIKLSDRTIHRNAGNVSLSL